ncbi:hypothetical protein INT80_12425 [Gallibacterium anatis]|uniref:Uncharacterized protein n=1 Tax=Gallibacterium anatis TaxID=750 RepID=A0A930UYB2_9PAST|nr:hypothetical protein [Gallibacterium anatis]
MGDGNDTFEVTGTAKDTEDPNKAGAVRDEMKYASLYATNAKIDMGAGNDKVSIKGMWPPARNKSQVITLTLARVMTHNDWVEMFWGNCVKKLP